MPGLADVTAADLKARYPVFKDQDAAFVTALLDEARGSVNDTWIEGDRVPALLAYTAYLIASDQASGATIAVGDGLNVGISGPLSEVWVGDVKAKFAESKGGSGGGSGGGDASPMSPAAASYWAQYQRFYRRSFPAIMVV